MTSLRGLTRPRTDARPGPGEMAEALLRALDLQVARRIDGLLAGEFAAMRLGRGTELAQVRVYEPGSDDVRDIDWNVTARTGEAHVRVHVAERVVTTWVLLDVSASMGFGTADRVKADVAEGVALAIGHLASRRGNRVGAMTFGEHAEDRFQVAAPAQGRAGLLRLLNVLRTETARDGGGPTSLRLALQRIRGVARGRSAIFVISDLRGPTDWQPTLMELSDLHDVIAVEISDPREDELVDIGTVWMIDPETGEQLRVETGRREVRARFAEAAAAERAAVRQLVRGARADHTQLSTRGDWLHELARFMATRKVRR